MKNSGSNPFKKTIITLGVLSVFVIGLQFTSPVIENPPVKNNIELPQNVKAILKKACFDCHSNQSNTKWFDRFAPVSYMVAHDIKEARSRFNLSEWDRNPPGIQELLLWEMVNAIEQGKMPLPRYQMFHPGAHVTSTELALLKRYVNTLPGRNRLDTTTIIGAADKAMLSTVSAPSKVPVSLNGIPYFADYKNWAIISVTNKFDAGSMRIVYGNDIMVKAIREHQLPFPDGAKIVKVVWGKQQADKDGNVLPGNFQNVQIMIKDSKKYSSTEGWGFAKFDGLQLKPVGKTALFANTCINCHRLLVPENDFVFNIPTK